jgi:hypothetical protein
MLSYFQFTFTRACRRALETLFGPSERERRERSEAAIRRLQEAARYGTPTLEQRNAIDDLEWLPRRMGGR